MKSLEEISMLTKVVTSMVKEAKDSDVIKKAKAEVNEDINSIKKSELPKKIAKDMMTKGKAKVQMIKEMASSDEVQFLKAAIKESEQFKKLAKNVDTISDMIPFPIKREYIGYKYWLITNKIFLNLALSVPPVKLIEYFLKYPWLFDYAKVNSTITKYTEKRTGANFYAMHEEWKFLVEKQAEGIINAINHPDKLILVQNVVSTEILLAMGLFPHPIELGTLLGKLDQWSYLEYLELGENVGLSVDTCSLPKSTLGLAISGHLLPSKIVLTSNYPCDGSMSSYNYFEEKLGLTTYCLNMPYDLRGEEYLDHLVVDLYGMISFLEKEAGGVMDWDKLKEICENFNSIVNGEFERWDMLKLDNPPLCNDGFQQIHYFQFSYMGSLPGASKTHKKLLEITKKAIAKGMPAFEGMRYRVIMWNPAPSAWGHWYNWLERCWGIGVVMDLESSGPMPLIDTSTREGMMRGLAQRHLLQIMAKHTKGPASNYLNDLYISLDEMRPDFVLLPKPVGCKNVMTMEAMVKEECKRRNVPVCTFKMDLQDNRVASRQQIRDEISKFMQDVMHSEPLDPSLLILDDCDLGKW